MKQKEVQITNAIEQLVFQVKEAAIDQFLKKDQEIWTETLSNYPGFLKKETWKSNDNHEEIMTLIYWETIEQWKAIPEEVLSQTQDKFDKEVGSENYRFIAGYHETNQMYKISEYVAPIKNPQAIEQLIFQVKEEKIDCFLEYDSSIWTTYLRKQPGFISKEVWVNESRRGEVTTVTYWKDLEAWKQVDNDKLKELGMLFEEKVGRENYQLVTNNMDNQRYRVSVTNAQQDGEKDEIRE